MKTAIVIFFTGLVIFFTGLIGWCCSSTPAPSFLINVDPVVAAQHACVDYTEAVCNKIAECFGYQPRKCTEAALLGDNVCEGTYAIAHPVAPCLEAIRTSSCTEPEYPQVCKGVFLRLTTEETL